MFPKSRVLFPYYYHHSSLNNLAFLRDSASSPFLSNASTAAYLFITICSLIRCNHVIWKTKRKLKLRIAERAKTFNQRSYRLMGRENCVINVCTLFLFVQCFCIIFYDTVFSPTINARINKIQILSPLRWVMEAKNGDSVFSWNLLPCETGSQTHA